jgi:hypothetical protein
VKSVLEEHLTRAVLAAIMLLEDSSAEEIDRDVAANGLENIAAELNIMDDQERQRFRAVLRRVVDREPEYGPYLELPRLLGWDD